MYAKGPREVAAFVRTDVPDSARQHVCSGVDFSTELGVVSVFYGAGSRPSSHSKGHVLI